MYDVVVVGAGAARIPCAREAAPSELGWLGDLAAAWAPEIARIGYGHEPCLTPRTVGLRLRARVPRLLPGPGVIVAGALTTPALVLGRELGHRLGRAA